MRQILVYKKGMSFEDAKRIAQKISNQNAKGHSGKIWTNLKYKTGWMRQQSSNLGEPVKLFSFDQYDDADITEFTQDKFDEIEIMIERSPTKKGGKD